MTTGMMGRAIFLVTPLLLGGCAMQNQPPRDPTRPDPAAQAMRAQQHAQALQKAQARLATEQAACSKGNRRACTRATAAQAVVNDLNSQ
jgi:predicted lipid-binding transport protein (Tim44 family)